MLHRLAKPAADAAFAAAMATQGRAALRALLRQADRPEAVQHETLQAILRHQRETEFAERFGFTDIRDTAGYQRAVPVHSYEDLRPLVERQIATGSPVLVAQRPLMYARTSGTTAKPKLVPVTREVVRRVVANQRAGAQAEHRACPMFAGRILAIAGAMREETLADGTPAGAVSGLLYQTTPPVVRAKYVLPVEVFEIADYDTRYAVIARLGLQHGDITALATANPSTLLRLFDVIRADFDRFVHEIAAGTCRELAFLPAPLASAVRRKLRRDTRRAGDLAALARRGGPNSLGEIWPTVAATATWTGGSCRLAAGLLKRHFHEDARIIELGYVASELRGTVVVDAVRGLGLPTIGDTFFEFLSVDERERGGTRFRLLHELDVGDQYYVFVTTFGGLYRYDMNDVLEVTGHVGRTPALAFVRKGLGVTSITGEKLTEEQLTLAVTQTAAKLGLAVVFYLCLADEQAAQYRLFIEAADLPGAGQPGAAASLFDGALQAVNIEYAAKRHSGRLQPLQLLLLRAGTGDAFRRHAVASGQRDSQFKVLPLRYARDCNFDVMAAAVEARSCS
jgi:hypothetical protein